MSSKSYLVSSPTSHKSISPGSLLLSSRGVAWRPARSGRLLPDHAGPCPLPHRLAARAARRPWPPATRPTLATRGRARALLTRRYDPPSSFRALVAQPQDPPNNFRAFGFREERER